MPGIKTNERPGTRAVLRHARVSPSKVREVLNLIRNKPVHEAEDILRFSERDSAILVGKVLHSAVANAENNDSQDPETLYVSACFADEGTTIKRWRPRARGRPSRVRKRTSHITIIVSRLPGEELARLQAHRRAEQLAQRARRVAGARGGEGSSRAQRRRRLRRGGGLEEEELIEPEETEAAEMVQAGETEEEAPEAEVEETETSEEDSAPEERVEESETTNEQGNDEPGQGSEPASEEND